MKQLIRNNIYIIVCILLINIGMSFVFIGSILRRIICYSLSKVSKTIVQNTLDPITVDFYVTENLPQDLKKLAKEFVYLLKEYKSLSNDYFTINIIHPNNEQTGQKAIEAGIQPLLIEISERDLEKIQNIFMGAIFRIGNKQSVIPFINHNTPLEYEITRLLKQSTDTLKPRVGFIKGHREASLGQMPQLINELSHLTDISVIDLFNTHELERYNVLCIIDPKDVYSPYEKEQIDKYLREGGRLFVALNHAVGQINESQNNGFINWTGIEDILEEKGLKIQYEFCGRQQLRNNYRQSAKRFYELPE